MFFINSYFTVALGLAVIGGVSLLILHWRHSLATENRMKRMMLSCGIDKRAVEEADQHLCLDLDAIRSRCRQCPVTYLCDRWLDGEAVANNSFCPNAWLFLRAAGAGQA
jgi:hypothetical protein